MDAAVDRRTFLLLSADAAAGLAAGWVSVPPAGKISRVLQGGTVDAEMAEWVEGWVRQLRHLDDLVGGQDCLGLAQAELRLVLRLLIRGGHREEL